MQTIPKEGSAIIVAFNCLFSKKVFEHVKVLLMGALLTVGRHTVCAALRFIGLNKEPNFHKYHRILSLVHWSTLQASRILLQLLVQCFTPGGDHPLVFGIDETIERRTGAKIKAKGIYRDPVRSSEKHLVKCSGLRWMCLMLLAPVPWAARVWALPFMSVLAPSERYCTEQGKRHKKITQWARQIILQLTRWLPQRALIIVADSSYAVLELLAAVQQQVCFITRLQLRAALYDPAPTARRAGQKGPNPLKGARQPKLQERLLDEATRWQPLTVAQWYGQRDKQLLVATGTALWYHVGTPPVSIRWVLIKDAQGKQPPQALLCTDLTLSAAQILAYFSRRWSMEVTLEESRAHLGVETQRQWSDPAIARTTPVLLGLFSIVTLWADQLHKQQLLKVEQTAWYHKQHITFSDAIAAVRSSIYKQANNDTCTPANDMLLIPKQLYEQLTNLITRAA
jgi:DDE superfamily endonuclease